MSGMPNLYVIAGPNGAGKTTFARKFLPLYAKCPHFINADLIAQGLSPFQPELAAIKAGRALLTEVVDLINSKATFSFETTLSGRTPLSFLTHARDLGYQVHIFYLWVTNANLSLARIKDRVAKGGHNITASDVKRRFPRSIKNFFNFYIPLAHTWHLFDNSREQPVLIAKKTGESNITVIDNLLFDKIYEEFGK